MKPATLEASNILLPYKLPIQSFAPLIQSIVCLDAAPRGFSRGVVVDFWWLWLYNREKCVECEVLLTEVGKMTQVETNISIRPLSGDDIPLMETFLYEAIFVPEGVEKPPREIILQPELAIYVRGFGKCIGDHGVVAEINSEIVGMAWTRIMADYGHIDDATPSLAIAVLPEYRGRGIGTALLEQLLEQLRAAGYVAVSLSVQQENPALHLYERLGFEPVRVADGEVVMRCAL